MPEALAAAEIVAGRRLQRAPAQTPLATPLLGPCLAEASGTFLLVFFGVGAVHASVLTGAQSGIWQVAVVWAIAVAVAIHATASISGAHINPAVTAAFALFRGFPKRRVLPYWAAQLAGAFVAAAALHLLFHPTLEAFERAQGIVRGAPGSERSAMCYGQYFPSPATGIDGEAHARVPELTAFAAEAIGTAVLVFVVFALTAQRDREGPGQAMAPLLIGLTVGALISVLAPLTQASFNPARDFGPRVFAWLAGWGTVAIPGPRGGFFTVYILAPLLGALAGAGVHRALLGRHGTGSH
jgi:glycerol uptake facilitator